ncbi:helix-turn-helix domain-containing protein [Tenacibaculum sp. SDUM215027]|uniref:helix-turn-helix domain-containing protein n=1 Tax=Tenacibaculum sp. SDUM215027 TaxID=3422596 RepID=UPI003D31DE65
MEISFIHFFTLVAIIHCFILSLIILCSKFFKNNTNKFLSFTLLIIAIVGINNWFWDLNKDALVINIIDLGLWQFLYPVTYFFFFHKASNPTNKKSSKLTFLYLPFIILSLLNITISLGTVFHIYSLDIVIPFYFYKAISFLSIIFPLLLVLISYKYTFSAKNKIGERWLKHLWFSFSFILIYGIILESYRFIYSEKLPLTHLWSTISILIYWLIYKGLYQFKLSNDQYEIRTILKNTQSKDVFVKKKENTHYQKIVELLETEHIYRNPNLSRNSLAEQLEISNSYLSQIIKSNTSKNFSELINSYRIKEAKEMLKNPLFNDYSLLSIGLECGFNSKTSFYVNFKKETNLTPKQYRNQ